MYNAYEKIRHVLEKIKSRKTKEINQRNKETKPRKNIKKKGKEKPKKAIAELGMLRALGTALTTAALLIHLSLYYQVLVILVIEILKIFVPRDNKLNGNV